jgi:Flp pilus assembly protein TadD
MARASQRYPAVSNATGSQPRIADLPTEAPPPSPEQQRAEAESARQRGEMALRREQFEAAIEEFSKAVKAAPKDGACSALLAWTQFCVSTDKASIANEVRRTLALAMQATDEPIAQLYLGRVERMLGRDREALRHFKEVLELHPRNTEALSEARVLEGRLQNRSSGGFGKPKR